MKKIVTLFYLAISLFADGDYIPLSKLSDDKKIEYNFMDAKKIPNKKIKKDEEFHPVKSIENSEIKKEIVQEKTEKIQENNTTLNKDFVKDYKKDNILQDEKKYSQNSFIKDFSITPKITDTFLTSDIHETEKVHPEDKENVFVPEISIKYKEHTLKAEVLNAKASYSNVLLVGSDLETRVRWFKLYYLYNYENINLGLAYNNYKADFIVVDYDVNFRTKEEFPSLEFNGKNEENKFEVNYGASYGQNNYIDYAYEYYVNFGYKIFQNDALNINAGYRNRTIDYNDRKYQYAGPTLSLSSTF
jgi:hypothetical protein